MSGEDTSAPDEGQDKPEGAPEGTSAEESQIDWATEGPKIKESYEGLRSKFNERDQEIARLRNLDAALRGDPEHAALLAEYGYALTDPDEEREDEDPEPYVTRDEWERDQQARQQADQQQYEAGLREDVLDHLVALDGDLSDEDLWDLFSRAWNNGRPNEELTEKVYGDYKTRRKSLEDAAVERYLAEKKGVPRPGAGAAAVEKIDRSDPKQRKAYIDQRFAELSAEQ